MTIKTKWEFGEEVVINGKTKTIRGVHVYVSDTGTQTERYYLGNQEWHTIHIVFPKGVNND